MHNEVSTNICLLIYLSITKFHNTALIVASKLISILTYKNAMHVSMWLDFGKKNILNCASGKINPIRPVRYHTTSLCLQPNYSSLVLVVRWGQFVVLGLVLGLASKRINGEQANSLIKLTKWLLCDCYCVSATK